MMNGYDEEIDNIASSIERYLKRQYRIRNIVFIILFFGMVFFIYNMIEYPGNQTPPPLNIILIISLIFPFMGLSYVDKDSIEKRTFKNMQEIIFFYLFFSWKYRNDDGVKYLKKCTNKIQIYLDDYDDLAYTEEIYLTFNNLLDVLTYHIYPALGVRTDIKGQEDLIKYTSSWNEFKTLSINFYQNAPINLINENICSVKDHFERHEGVKMIDENQSIKSTKAFFSWNIEVYKNSLSYRFFLYTAITAIISVFLIFRNVDIDVILPAMVLIPVMAPYYLAPKQ